MNRFFLMIGLSSALHLGAMIPIGAATTGGTPINRPGPGVPIVQPVNGDGGSGGGGKGPVTCSCSNCPPQDGNPDVTRCETGSGYLSCWYSDGTYYSHPCK